MNLYFFLPIQRIKFALTAFIKGFTYLYYSTSIKTRPLNSSIQTFIFQGELECLFLPNGSESFK